ncbi:hypothetical protein GCK72_016894 [Caenorhabditis remanei]|uniref:Homeobox domain-containing protein n=1 Tax=Caenorhabditis remanei TaxID=31234 RepID=A0A6A5G6Q8_CAERE|nr:hypothetical protein GCK72_016894 [Caenorhabditis remanei]KAF1750345.1 hypothetical protein GCK72_016894 [Caenorhabditis remanei]
MDLEYIELVILTKILSNSTPLDEIKAALSSYPEDNDFRKKCEIAVAVREGRPMDVVLITVSLIGADFLDGFLVENLGSRSKPETPPHSMALPESKEPKNCLNNADRAYIHLKYKEMNEHVPIDEKRKIAQHLGVTLIKVQNRISYLTRHSQKLQGVEKKRRLNKSEREYITKEYQKNDGQLTGEQKKEIAKHLGLPVRKVQGRVNRMKSYEHEKRKKTVKQILDNYQISYEQLVESDKE